MNVASPPRPPPPALVKEHVPGDLSPHSPSTGIGGDEDIAPSAAISIPVASIMAGTNNPSHETISVVSKAAGVDVAAAPRSPSSISAQTLSDKTAATHPGMVLPYLGFVPYRYISLALLVAQTVGAIFVMRVSRTIYADPNGAYLNSTAVVMAEVIKLLGSLALTLRDEDYDWRRCYELIRSTVYEKRDETLKVGVPAALYTLQNNLLFIALSNLSGAMYQITYQLKILTTALLSVLLLRKRLGLDQWLSLFLLTAGVALIQMPAGGTKAAPLPSSFGSVAVGTVAVLAACVTSGLAGVYFEKILKNSKTSIWLRNMQLASFGIVIGLIGVMWNDGAAVSKNGFFQGYNKYTWLAILMQSAGGLIVAAVLKYADNILKCFGNALAIVISCLVSYYFVGDYQPTILFALGAMIVCFATYTYGVNVPLIFYIQHPKKIARQMGKAVRTLRQRRSRRHSGVTGVEV